MLVFNYLATCSPRNRRR